MSAESSTPDDRIIDVHELHPAVSNKNMRLDRFVAEGLPDLSRTYLQRLIEDGFVLVDGVVRRTTFKMTPGQVVSVSVPEVVDFAALPEAIPLDVLFEDSDVLVIDKPAGMVVHPAPGHHSGTLVNALLHHAPETSIAGSNRPGIVHRLDKDTSGVMVIAKTDRAQTSLVRQWQERTVDKRYIALVSGEIDEDEATINAPIGRDPANRLRMAAHRSGKEAITHFAVNTRYTTSTLLDVRIDTGRTHQIRVHLGMIGHPVVGDGLYGTSRSRSDAHDLGVKRQFLHASRLAFEVPSGERKVFDVPLAGDLRAALERTTLRTDDR